MALTSPQQEITTLKTKLSTLEKRVETLARLNELLVKHIAKAEDPRPPGMPPKPFDARKHLQDLMDELRRDGFTGRRF